MKKIFSVGSDFSGIGAFDQALTRLGIPYRTVFACDMDKYARKAYAANYGTENDYVLSCIDSLGKTTVQAEDYSFYFPKDVYDRKIPKEPLDIYMTSPPCQAFSLAGKRKGEDDKRGVLFYNSHEFIQSNNPRYFIFENVKGLLSDDSGKTFQRWLDFLGGKSVNGNPVIFPHEESVPYHIYWRVLNAKHYGVPQNRERVFIIGIRDDVDNDFRWPKEMPLTKKLKDVLETDVDEKYFLSDKLLNGFLKHTEKHKEKGNGFAFKPKGTEDVGNAVTARCFKMGVDYNYIKIKSATLKGYETATENDSINFSQPNSDTRRGRVGKEVAQTLDTACNQGILIGSIRGRNPDNPKSRKSGLPTEQQLEINKNGTSNALTTVQKDNVVVQLNPSKESGGKQPYKQNRIYDSNGISPVLDTECGRPGYLNDYKIRRLTPREALRLMDFPDSFEIVCSDSQTYKQAGNSIVVAVLEFIIKKLLKL